MRSYLLIFAPVFAAGVFTGWAVPWFVRTWRASTALMAEIKHAADDQPVPYWPAEPRLGSSDAEWQRIVAAIKADGL